MYLAFAVGGRAEHDFLASGYLCRNGKHQDGREQGSRSARNVEAYLFDGDRLLPAGHARNGFHFLAFELLCGMERTDVFQRTQDGFLQFAPDGFLGFIEFFRGHEKRA